MGNIFSIRLTDEDKIHFQTEISDESGYGREQPRTVGSRCAVCKTACQKVCTVANRTGTVCDSDAVRTWRQKVYGDSPQRGNSVLLQDNG